MAMKKTKSKDVGVVGSSDPNVTTSTMETLNGWIEMRKSVQLKIWKLTSNLVRMNEVAVVLWALCLALKTGARKYFIGLVNDLIGGKYHSVIAQAREQYLDMKSQFMSSKELMAIARSIAWDRGEKAWILSPLGKVAAKLEEAASQYKETKRSVRADTIRLGVLRRNGDKESLLEAKKFVKSIKAGRKLMTALSKESRKATTELATILFLSKYVNQKWCDPWHGHPYVYERIAEVLVIGSGVKFRACVELTWHGGELKPVELKDRWHGTRAFIKLVDSFDELTYADSVPEGLEMLESVEVVDEDGGFDWTPSDLTEEQKARYRFENDGNRNMVEIEYDHELFEYEPGIPLQPLEVTAFMRGGYVLERLIPEAMGELTPWQNVIFRDRSNAVALTQIEIRTGKMVRPEKGNVLARHSSVKRYDGMPENIEFQRLSVNPTAQTTSGWMKACSLSYAMFEDMVNKAISMAYGFVLNNPGEFGRVTDERYAEWCERNGLKDVRPVELSELNLPVYMYQVRKSFYWIWDKRETCSILSSTVHPDTVLERYYVTPFFQVFYDKQKKRYNGSLNMLVQNLDKSAEKLMSYRLDALPGSRVEKFISGLVRNYVLHQPYQPVRLVARDHRNSEAAMKLLEAHGPARRLRSHRFTTEKMTPALFRKRHRAAPPEVRPVKLPDFKVMEYTQGTGIPEARKFCPMENFITRMDLEVTLMSFEV